MSTAPLSAPASVTQAGTQCAFGEIKPLPIPSCQWDSASMDFIMTLPKTRQGCTAVLVFVGRLTKMLHAVLTVDSVTAEQTALLLVSNVLAAWAAKVIRLNQGSEDTRNILRSSSRNFADNIGNPTCFHPRTDGLTERSSDH